MKAIPGARDVIRELAQLVVEGAALMDESMKYTMLCEMGYFRCHYRDIDYNSSQCGLLNRLYLPI